MNDKKALTENDIKAIEEVLAKGNRVELIPVQDGKTKIVHVKRQAIKVPKGNS